MKIDYLPTDQLRSIMRSTGMDEISARLEWVRRALFDRAIVQQQAAEIALRARKGWAK